MATPTPSKPEPAPQPDQRETQLIQQQKLAGGVDPAQLFLAGHVMDAQTRLLIERQLNLCQQQLNMQQQSQLGSASMGLFQGGGSSLALQQQIQAQKQQQARMLQLQQLMALNLQRQQNRRTTSNNFRASAA